MDRIAFRTLCLATVWLSLWCSAAVAETGDDEDALEERTEASLAMTGEDVDLLFAYARSGADEDCTYILKQCLKNKSKESVDTCMERHRCDVTWPDP